MAANIPVLIVEHDIDRVLGFSHRVTVMNQGEVLMTGTPDEVRADRRVQEIYTGTGTPTRASPAPPRRRPARHADSARSRASMRSTARATSSTTQHWTCARARSSRCSGRNGAGKSTLLKTLRDWFRRRPARSNMKAAISPACRRRISRGSGIGYVPQGRGLFAGMTVARKSRARPPGAQDRRQPRRRMERRADPPILPAPEGAHARRGGLSVRRRAADAGGGARHCRATSSCCCWTSRSRAWRRP